MISCVSDTTSLASDPPAIHAWWVDADPTSENVSVIQIAILHSSNQTANDLVRHVEVRLLILHPP